MESRKRGPKGEKGEGEDLLRFSSVRYAGEMGKGGFDET